MLFRVATRTQVEPGFTAEEALSEAQQALRVFEELGDERGQALAWGTSAILHGRAATTRRRVRRSSGRWHTRAQPETSECRMRARAFIGFCLF